MSKWINDTTGKSIDKPPEETHGFVYMIYCINPKLEYFGWTYIGKKAFWSFTNAKVSKKRSTELWSGKGRKPVREKKIKESDWKKYCSSSKTLKDLIKEVGEDSFRFIILDFASDKSDLSMKEVEWMVNEGVMRDPKNWNMWISAKIMKCNLIE